MELERILSGGQTGADRAALDWAIANNVPHGGWCPLGRLAEDGRIDDRYSLRETPSPDYIQRTEWNVRDADATVIFSSASVLTGGSLATAELATIQGKPFLHLHNDRPATDNADILEEFLLVKKVRALNVAGPRASGDTKAYRLVHTVLDALVDKDRKTCE